MGSMRMRGGVLGVLLAGMTGCSGGRVATERATGRTTAPMPPPLGPPTSAIGSAAPGASARPDPTPFAGSVDLAPPPAPSPPRPPPSPIRRWIAIPRPPANVVARTVAQATTSTWSGERLHVLDERGEGAAFEPALQRWTDSPAGPAPKSTEAPLDTMNGGGPPEPASSGARLATARDAELVPLAFKGAFTWFDGFDGATLRLNGGLAIVLPHENAPSPRVQYLFARVKDGIVIWGGYTEQGPTDTGAIYDRRSGVWRPTRSANAPTPRRYPATRTWTGSRLIVFGSHYSGDPHPDGALLDPTDGSWTPIPAGGPALTLQEAFDSIVWSGRLLVFFGTNKAGAIYDPVANSWRPIRAIPGLAPSFLVRAWSAPNGQIVIARLAAAHQKSALYLATLDPATGDVRELPPAPLAATEEQAVHFNGNTLLVWGGSSSKMTSPGGGCTGPRRPTDPVCDPVGPGYATTRYADGAAIRLY